MMPNAKKSRRTVTRMNVNAARLAWGCGLVGTVEDKASSPKEGEIVAGN
jgi:hypothetical protein